VRESPEMEVKFDLLVETFKFLFSVPVTYFKRNYFQTKLFLLNLRTKTIVRIELNIFY